MKRDAAVDAAHPASQGETKDLKTRVLSALVLAAAALAANFSGPALFAALVAALSLIMSWEWSRIVRSGAFDMVFTVHAASVAAAATLAAFGMASLGLAALGIGAILMAILTLGSSARLSAMGVLYVGLPAVSLIWLRGSEVYGAWAILFIFAVVWIYDTAAFAAGSAIGGPKLMPRISPRKTWAGLAGGVAACGLAGAAFGLALAGSPAWLAGIAMAFGIVAQGGDLLESALKRGRGVKDASGLVPGHGGVMDRLDSTVAVAVAAGLVALAIDPRAPAHALLFGV